jgi:hypothetical protein
MLYELGMDRSHRLQTRPEAAFRNRKYDEVLYDLLGDYQRQLARTLPLLGAVANCFVLAGQSVKF